MIATLFLAGLALLPQEESSPNKAFPVHTLDDVVLEYYAVQDSHAARLYGELNEMIGRSFYLLEQGGRSGNRVRNLRHLGTNLIVYDTPDYVRRVLEMARRLDLGQADAGQDERLQTLHYTLRHTTMAMLARALEHVELDVDPGSGISYVEGRNMVILRQRPARMQEIKELLRVLDVAERQILLTCWLLRGVPKGAADPVGVPEDLRTNLEQLVPEYSFESIGFGMLRSAVSPGRRRELQVAEQGATLYFEPIAFDEETGALSVQNCQMMMVKDGKRGSLFTTDTVLRGGEYTVLGAVGNQPMFVVVRTRAL